MNLSTMQHSFREVADRRLVGAGLVWGIWTVFGLVFATQRYIERAYADNPTSLVRVVTAWAACAYLWAALTPLVAWLARRFPLGRNGWHRNLLAHAVIGTAISIAHLAVYLELLELLVAGGSGTFASTEMLKQMIVADLHFNLVLYGAIVAAAHYIEYRRKLLEQGAAYSLLERKLDLSTQAGVTSAPLDKLAVKVRNGVALLKVDDISWMRSDENYVHIRCAGKNYMHRTSLSGLLGQLDATKFVRIRRSTAVNVQKVTKLLPVRDREYTIVLEDGSRLQSSRRYRKNLKF